MSTDPQYSDIGFNTCDEVGPNCPVEATLYGDYFTLGACVFFCVFHGILILYQSGLAFKAKTWSFSAWLWCGTVLEFLGYLGRAIMTDNPWNYSAFILQLLALILGPTFVAAALSVTCKHIVLSYGQQYCILKPKVIPWLFVGSDFGSIAIQALGGGLSSAATGGEYNQSLADTGSALLVAGVAFQAANMIAAGLVMLHFMWRYKKAKSSGVQMEEPTTQRDEKSSKRFTLFCWAIAVGFVTIIIRCIYRIPEQAMGWGSTLMQNETTFCILDGMMVGIAILTVTIFHPAFFFPQLSSKYPANASRRNSGDVEEKAASPDESSH